MKTIDRTNRSPIALWWWTIDRWTLTAIILLIVAGTILIMSASPPVASRIKLDPNHFVLRHFIHLVPALILMFVSSLLPPHLVARGAAVMLAGSLVLLVLTPLLAVETKGAHRWISIAGFSIQASEFAKPSLAVVIAWLFSTARSNPSFPGYIISFVLVGFIVALLVKQPDIGMTLTVIAIWAGQFFLAGLPLRIGGILVVLFVALFGFLYATIGYVQDRVDGYFDPKVTDSYQVETSIKVLESGGFFGKGFNEGVIKSNLPDAHADFIFAVAGEEFGLVTCLILTTLFAFVVLRSIGRLSQERDLFVLLAVAGLLIQFTLQAFVNMGVTLQLVPTTGMTLPFVSYGGSSLVSIAIGMGMMLALTRRRPSHGFDT